MGHGVLVIVALWLPKIVLPGSADSRIWGALGEDTFSGLHFPPWNAEPVALPSLISPSQDESQSSTSGGRGEEHRFLIPVLPLHCHCCLLMLLPCLVVDPAAGKAISDFKLESISGRGES